MSASVSSTYSTQPIEIPKSKYHNDLDLAILHAVLGVPVRRGPSFYQGADGEVIRIERDTVDRIDKLLKQAEGLILVARGSNGLPLLRSGIPISNLPDIMVWATKDPETATKARRYLSQYEDWISVSLLRRGTRDVITNFCTEYLIFDAVSIALVPPNAFDIMYAEIPSSHDYHVVKACGLINGGLLPVVSMMLPKEESHHHPTVILYFLIRAVDQLLRQHSVLPGLAGSRMYSIIFNYVDVVKMTEGVRLIFPAISRRFAEAVALRVRPYKYSYAKDSPLEHHLSLPIPSLHHNGMCVWEGDMRPVLNPIITLIGKNTEEPVTLTEFDDMSLQERFEVIKCGVHLYSIDTLRSIVEEPRVLPIDRLPLEPHVVRSKLYFKGIIRHHSKPGIVPFEPPHIYTYRNGRYYITDGISFPEEVWTQIPYYMPAQREGSTVDEDGIYYVDGTPVIPTFSYHTVSLGGMTMSFVADHDINRIKRNVRESFTRGMGMPLWRYFYPQSDISHYLAVSPSDQHGVSSDYVIAALTSEFP